MSKLSFAVFAVLNWTNYPLSSFDEGFINARIF